MSDFLSQKSERDPRSQKTLSEGEIHSAGVDFDAILADARWNRLCAECGVDLELWLRPQPFCSAKCRYRFRDRRRYAEDPEGQRERARAYYLAHREKVLEKAAERRGRRPVVEATCSECGEPLEGGKRVVCGERRCKEARFKRLNPEAYAAREAAKVARRRERRKLGSP